MVALKLLLAATASGLVTAWPEPTAAASLNNHAIDCSKLTGCLGVLKKIGPPATTFCRSYLRVPGTKTSTTTFTPPTVTSTTSTLTVTVTSAACVQQKRYEPSENRGFEYARAANVEELDKRTEVLALLVGFAAAKISEGCNCLNLQPTVNKITTLTAPAPTVQVVATSTSCVVAQPVCKSSDLGSTCTQVSECCSGFCGTSFGSSTCCNPAGAYCDLGNPGACCGGTCVSSENGSGGGTCLGP